MHDDQPLKTTAKGLTREMSKSFQHKCTMSSVMLFKNGEWSQTGGGAGLKSQLIGRLGQEFQFQPTTGNLARTLSQKEKEKNAGGGRWETKTQRSSTHPLGQRVSDPSCGAQTLNWRERAEVTSHRRRLFRFGGCLSNSFLLSGRCAGLRPGEAR